MKKYLFGLTGLVFAVVLMGASCAKTQTPVTTDSQTSLTGSGGGLDTDLNGEAETTTPVSTTTAKTVTVSFTGTAFSPSTLSINAGDTVKFVNNSDVSMWPAAGPHPTHTSLPSFDAKQAIAPGGTYSYTFAAAGTIPFHNHLNPTIFGSISIK